MSFRIDDEKLLQKYKAIWTKLDYLDSALNKDENHYCYKIF